MSISLASNGRSTSPQTNQPANPVGADSPKMADVRALITSIAVNNSIPVASNDNAQPKVDKPLTSPKGPAAKTAAAAQQMKKAEMTQAKAKEQEKKKSLLRKVFNTLGEIATQAKSAAGDGITRIAHFSGQLAGMGIKGVAGAAVAGLSMLLDKKRKAEAKAKSAQQPEPVPNITTQKENVINKHAAAQKAPAPQAPTKSASAQPRAMSLVPVGSRTGEKNTNVLFERQKAAVTPPPHQNTVTRAPATTGPLTKSSQAIAA